MVNRLASVIVNGSAPEVALGVAVCLATGLMAGFMNGCLVVYGRLQPIVATLATGAVYTGIDLFLRPSPVGRVSGGLSDPLTCELIEAVPEALALGALGYATSRPRSRPSSRPCR